MNKGEKKYICIGGRKMKEIYVEDIFDIQTYDDFNSDICFSYKGWNDIRIYRGLSYLKEFRMSKHFDRLVERINKYLIEIDVSLKFIIGEEESE